MGTPLELLWFLPIVACLAMIEVMVKYGRPAHESEEDEI